jgi:hypothetical protein
MANPTLYVEAPPLRIPRLGGIGPIATFIDGQDRIAAASVVEWLNDTCLVLPLDAPGLCWGIDPGGNKTFDGMSIGQSDAPFGGYYGIECFLQGADYLARAEAGLAQTEDRYIEKFIATTTPTAGPTGADVAKAVGIADGYLDANYPGRPVIYVSRTDAVALGGQQILHGDQQGNMWTINGTPVVASSQFPTGMVLGSGQPTVYRSAISSAIATDQTHNRQMAIAERVYAVAFDCIGPVKFTTP